MPAFKVQFFFSSFQQGWTETFFTNQSNFGAADTASMALANALVGPRHVSTDLQGYRITQASPAVPRQSINHVLNLPGQRPSTAVVGPAGTYAEDVAADSAFCRLSYSDGFNHAYMVRGLSELDLDRSSVTGGAVPSAALISALSAIGNLLVSGGWAGQHQDPTQQKWPVLAIGTGTVAGTTDILTIGATALAMGDIVHFNGVPLVTLPWLKGKWHLFASNGTTTITLQWRYTLQTSTTPTNCTVQKVAFLYPAITNLSFLDFRTRKTGRPTNLTRGRSRGVPFRRSLRVGA